MTVSNTNKKTSQSNIKLRLALGGLGAYFLLTVALAIFQPGSEKVFLCYWDPIAIPIQVAAVVTCFWYANRIRRNARWQAWGWALVGFATLIYGVGEGFWSYYEIIRGIEVPTPSWADVFYLAFYLFLPAGVACFFSGLPTDRKLRLLYDCGLYMSGGAVLGWYCLIQPLWKQSDVSTLAKTVNVIYCMGDLVVLICAIALVMAPQIGRNVKLALSILAGGALAMSVADVWFWVGTVGGGYEAGQWGDLGWNLGCTMIAAAPLFAAKVNPKSGKPWINLEAYLPNPGWPRLFRQAMPYLLVLGAFGFVLYEEISKSGHVSTVTYCISLALIVLFMIRQFLSSQEINKLYRDMIGLNKELSNSNKALEMARKEAEEMAGKAAAASKAKTEFLANMSHEIRTPLNGVIGMSGLLLKSHLDPQQERYTRTILYSGDLLLRVINDILDFSKIEVGMLELDAEDFCISDLVASTAESFAIQADEKKIELIYKIDKALPVMVRSDAHRLRQILGNLIGNAIKFTDHGEIVIECDLESIDENLAMIHFSVRDTGIGIELNRQDRLFKPFSQVDASTTRKYGGTGLGLVISGHLVRLMGGEIGVDSTPEKGSRFWFWLPFEISTAAPPASLVRLQEAPTLFAGARILVVDDNQVHRELLLEQLHSWGAHCAGSGSGPETVKLLSLANGNQTRAFDLIILDDFMPGIDGLELGRMIRKYPAYSDIAMLLLTSVAATPDRAELARLEIAECLTKPVRPALLQKAIAKALAYKLPLFQEQAAQPSETGNPAEPASRITYRNLSILLVEDNETNQMVFQEILGHFGARCDVVTNGWQALDKMETGRYDLVFMDCQMPFMDGYEATRRFRAWETAQDKGAHMAIVALTAHAQSGDRSKCLEAGMDDYLAKPVEPESIEVCLADWSRRLNKPALVDTMQIEPIKSINNDAAVAKLPVAAAQDMQELVDWPALITRCANNEKLAQQLLRRFLERTPHDLDNLAQAIKSGDVAGLATGAHSLKGAAATLSAEPLRRGVADLEQAARAGTTEELPQLLDCVRSEYERLLCYLEENVPQIENEQILVTTNKGTV
jgi:signal transduction histidine kinase/DNA-binding response OmpR family regulator/HPt (histidine-containing phosphotransfer) domain-containing protein